MLKIKSLILSATMFALAIGNTYAGNSGVIGTKEFRYTIYSAVLSSHCGDVRPAEAATYLMVKLTAKNVSSEEHSFGGFSGQFSVSRANYHYDVDGGAGLAFGSLRDAYTGIANFPPLMSKTMIVVFTVPSEIATGTWTVTMPTDETFDVTVSSTLYN
jgi:hypothetical protein